MWLIHRLFGLSVHIGELSYSLFDRVEALDTDSAFGPGAALAGLDHIERPQNVHYPVHE